MISRLAGNKTSNRSRLSVVFLHRIREPKGGGLSSSGSYNVDVGNSMMEVFASVENVLDEDPQFSSGAVGGANAIYFPILGQTYRVGLRFRL